MPGEEVEEAEASATVALSSKATATSTSTDQQESDEEGEICEDDDELEEGEIAEDNDGNQDGNDGPGNDDDDELEEGEISESELNPPKPIEVTDALSVTLKPKPEPTSESADNSNTEIGEQGSNKIDEEEDDDEEEEEEGEADEETKRKYEITLSNDASDPPADSSSNNNNKNNRDSTMNSPGNKAERIVCPQFAAGFCPRGHSCYLPHPSNLDPALIKAAAPEQSSSAGVVQDLFGRPVRPMPKKQKDSSWEWALEDSEDLIAKAKRKKRARRANNDKSAADEEGAWFQKQLEQERSARVAQEREVTASKPRERSVDDIDDDRDYRRRSHRRRSESRSPSWGRDRRRSRSRSPVRRWSRSRSRSLSPVGQDGRDRFGRQRRAHQDRKRHRHNRNDRSDRSDRALPVEDIDTSSLQPGSKRAEILKKLQDVEQEIAKKKALHETDTTRSGGKNKNQRMKDLVCYNCGDKHRTYSKDCTRPKNPDVRPPVKASSPEKDST